MAEVIVLASTALAVAFTVAWALRPGLRAWIERPKHTLARNLRAYEDALRDDAAVARDGRRP
jgi:hypothetical protein